MEAQVELMRAVSHHLHIALINEMGAPTGRGALEDVRKGLMAIEGELHVMLERLNDARGETNNERVEENAD
jgi:hypothetical protein